MSNQHESPTHSETPLEQYAAYDFDSDQVYQQGLASILESSTPAGNISPEAQEEILRRTRVFFFNKVTGNSITLDEVRDYEHSLRTQPSPDTVAESHSVPPAATSTELTSSAVTEASGTITEAGNDVAKPEAEVEAETNPHILTFNELKELIETGRLDQIPNNKIIPDALNEAPPSQSTSLPRKKPWEVSSENKNQGQEFSPSATT